jgi:hypothetical protein
VAAYGWAYGSVENAGSDSSNGATGLRSASIMDVGCRRTKHKPLLSEFS